MNNVYIEIKPAEVGLFRFLLEAYDNLAYFTVLESKRALLKICFSPNQKEECIKALQDIANVLAIKHIQFTYK